MEGQSNAEASLATTATPIASPSSLCGVPKIPGRQFFEDVGQRNDLDAVLGLLAGIARVEHDARVQSRKIGDGAQPLEVALVQLLSASSFSSWPQMTAIDP